MYAYHAKVETAFFLLRPSGCRSVAPALAPLAREGPEDGAFGLETCVSNGLCGACVSIGVSYFFAGLFTMFTVSNFVPRESERNGPLSHAQTHTV